MVNAAHNIQPGMNDCKKYKYLIFKMPNDLHCSYFYVVLISIKNLKYFFFILGTTGSLGMKNGINLVVWKVSMAFMMNMANFKWWTTMLIHMKVSMLKATSENFKYEHLFWTHCSLKTIIVLCYVNDLYYFLVYLWYSFNYF